MKLIEEIQAEPVAIWLTHAHIDHVGAVAAIQEKYSLPTYLNEGDTDWLAALPMQARMFRLPGIRMPPIDGPIVDGQTIRSREH